MYLTNQWILITYFKVISDEVMSLKYRNQELERNLFDAHAKLESLQESLKGEYQTYVDQLRRQVESLVDQINRMSDEREDSFAKIDRLESMLKSSSVKNEDLNREVGQLRKEVEAATSPSAIDPAQVQIRNQKNELLEDEIKYFKQLLFEEQHEKSNMRQVCVISLFSLILGPILRKVLKLMAKSRVCFSYGP